MTTYFPPIYLPQERPHPLGMALGQGLGQGISNEYQNFLLQKDIENLQRWQASQLPEGQVGPQLPFPSMRSPMGQQMAMQGMMQGIMPMTPYQNMMAQAALMNAQSRGALTPYQAGRLQLESEKLRRTPPATKVIGDTLYGWNAETGEYDRIIKAELTELEKAQLAEIKARTEQIGKPTPLTEEQRKKIIAETKRVEKEIERIGMPTPKTPEELEYYKARAVKAQAEVQRMADMGYSPEQIKLANTYRKEFDMLDKDYRQVRDSYGRVLAAAENPSAAGDLALIFNYMKMLDPGSVVRESEFANAAASGSLGQRWIAVGKRLLEGERLSDTMRADFLNRSHKLYTSQEKFHNALTRRYTKLSQQHKIEPSHVVTQSYEFSAKQAGKSPPISVTEKTEMTQAWNMAKRRLGSNATQEQIENLAVEIIKKARQKKQSITPR